MKWNWQQKDWPKFSYDQGSLKDLEGRLLQNSGMLIGAFRHINDRERQELTVDLISNEALKTSEIEGEILNRDSLQSSIRRNFGLSSDNRRVPLQEQGVSEMMIDLYRTFDTPLTEEQLCAWHKMLMSGRRDITDVGNYRTHEDPMQVVSGYVHDPKVHFEAPASKDVPIEMQRFIEWFNRCAPNSERSLSALLRASIAHLYFVSIHPFEDGNGRIARAISEKALSQSIGQPTLIAISNEIQNHKKDYYDALERNNKSNQITDWVGYFSQTILNAQGYTQKCIDFLIEKTKIYDNLRGKLNPRQDKVLDRMFREGVEGFTGGLSAENYISITRTSRATATRDLHDLVEKGALVKEGAKKYTRYHLNISAPLSE